MKNNLPALIFFCVGAVFALFFLVLAFFYIAREKKKRNAFDVSVTVLCSVALVLAVIIGLCAAFYKFPLEKVAVSGEYDAAFSLFGLNFTVPGFGAVLAFIMTPYGIALYSLALFALVFFAVIHPLRVLRKKEEQGVRASELKEPAVSETDSDLPHDADESEMPVKEEDDDFIIRLQGQQFRQIDAVKVRRPPAARAQGLNAAAAPILTPAHDWFLVWWGWYAPGLSTGIAARVLFLVLIGTINSFIIDVFMYVKSAWRARAPIRLNDYKKEKRPKAFTFRRCATRKL